MHRRLSATLVVLACGLAIGVTGAHISAQAGQEPGTVVLKRAPLGGVKFEHKLHAHERKIQCETCHHPERSGVAMKAANQACSTCHATKAIAPMKTSNRDAFHDGLARKGTCIDCHRERNAKAVKADEAPVRCAGCHIKGQG